MLIAQITDPHIRPRGKLAYRRVDTAGYLAATVAHLNALRPRVDLVLCTGDLTDLGLPEEYDHFLELVAPLQAPLHVIPGNHDDRRAMRRAFPELTARCGASGFVQYVLDEHPVRMIGLDTLTEGASHGALCAERLDWLERRLSEAPQRQTMIFMHHPPFATGIAHMDAINCHDGDALAAVLRRHPQVTRILCGHVHRSIVLQWHGVTASIAPSPAHSVALDLSPDGPSAFVVEPPACQLHHVRADGTVVSHLGFIGAFDGPYPFYAPDGSLIT